VNSGPRSSRNNGSRRKASALLRDEEVRLERPADEGEGGPEDRAAEPVQLSMPRVVIGRFSFVAAASAASYAGPRSATSGSNRSLEETRELEGDVGMGAETPGKRPRG